MRTRSITLVLWLVLLAFAHPALATWLDGTGNPVCTAPGDQLVSQVLPDGSQGTFVVWIDGRNGNQDIYAQRMTREGTIAAGWPANGVAVCTASGHQNSPVMASDGAGGIIVAWQDHRGAAWDIYAQRINPAGSVQWAVDGFPVCTIADDQTVPSIAADGAGGCYIVWMDAYGAETDIFAQHLTSSGAIVTGWTVNGTGVCYAPGPQSEPSMASADGGVYITWVDGRFLPTEQTLIYGMRVNANGTMAWPVNGVPFGEFMGRPQFGLASVSDGSNGVIATFITTSYFFPGQPGVHRIFAQRVDASGTRLWSSYARVDKDTAAPQDQPRLISDGAGGAFITWRAEGGNVGRILAMHLWSSGLKAWPNPITVGDQCGEDRAPTIIADMSGGMFIGWQQNTSDYPTCGSATTKAHVVRITVNGQLATGWPANGLQPASSASLYSNAPRLAADGEGGVFVAWDRSPGGPGTWDTHLQRFTGSGIRAPEVTPPAAVSDLEAIGGCETNIITWTAPADDGTQPVVAYRLYRNTQPGLPGGTIVPTPTPSSPGSAESVVDNVGGCSVPLYYYLDSQDEFGNWSPVSNTGGPAQTRCPAGGCMDLARGSMAPTTFRCLSNPARGQALFGYVVPKELAGKREIILIYDVSGRRVATGSDGPAQPGVRTIAWDMRSASGERVGAGVYYARLTLGQKTVSSRIVALK